MCAGLVVLPFAYGGDFDAKTTQQTETQLRSLATALGSAMTRTATRRTGVAVFCADRRASRNGHCKGRHGAGRFRRRYKTMENHAGREELKAAEGAGVGISVRPSETLGTA